jgi:hypothetical protein
MSVDIILSLGNDSLVGQWQCVFPKGIPGGGNADEVRLRMDQQFTMPQETITTYEIDYRGAKVMKTAKKEETDKTLTVSVRMDQQWHVYDTLKAWHRLIYDPVLNIASSDLDTRIPVVIQNLDQNNDIAKAFTFSYCKLTQLKVTDWDNTSGEPVRCECTLIYGYMEES